MTPKNPKMSQSINQSPSGSGNATMLVKNLDTEPDCTGIQDIRSRGDEASGLAEVFPIVNVRPWPVRTQSL